MKAFDLINALQYDQDLRLVSVKAKGDLVLIYEGNKQQLTNESMTGELFGDLDLQVLFVTIKDDIMSIYCDDM